MSDDLPSKGEYIQKGRVPPSPPTEFENSGRGRVPPEPPVEAISEVAPPPLPGSLPNVTGEVPPNPPAPLSEGD